MTHYPGIAEALDRAKADREAERALLLARLDRERRRADAAEAALAEIRKTVLSCGW